MDLTNHGPGAAPQYCFPILKSQEILSCIEEMGVEVSQQELADPIRHKEKLRQVWLALINHCAGKEEEDLQAPQAVKQEAENAKFPVLHEDFGDMFFFRTLRGILKASGYPFFGLSDLYAPSPKRLRVQLSALINLAKFREEQIEFLEQLNEPRQVWLEEIGRLEEETDVIRQELMNTEQSVEKESNELDTISKECQQLELEIAKQNKLQSAAREEANTLKRRANDLKDEVATAQWTLQEFEAEEEQLRGQIVSSPERRRTEVKTSRDELDKMKADVSRVDDLTQKGKTSCRNLQQALKDVSATMGNLDKLQEACNRKTEVFDKIEKVQGEIAAKQNERKALLEETQEAEREVGRAEEQIEAQRKQHYIQIEALQEALDSAKSQLLQVEKERRDGMIRVNQWEKEVERLEEEIEQQRLQTQQETEAMVAEYKVVEEEFLQVDQRRMESLQEATETVYD